MAYVLLSMDVQLICFVCLCQRARKSAMEFSRCSYIPMALVYRPTITLWRESLHSFFVYHTFHFEGVKKNPFGKCHLTEQVLDKIT